MLLPVFSLPVSAANRVRAVAEVPGFEPVNEELSYWKELLRDAGNSLESVTTPYRVTNWSHSGPDATKDPAAEGPKSGRENKPVEEAPAHRTEIMSDDMEPIPDEAVEPESAKAPVSFVPYFNELPIDERESLYSYENNLGAPPGQVEMDSFNEAAALRIKHRAGIANFSFGIPLASLSGRGIDAGVGLSYNSRTWNKSKTWDSGTQSYVDHYTYDVENSWIAPGFSSGLGYLTSNFVARNVVMDTEVQTLTEIVPEGIIEPDGTRRQISCRTWSQIPGGHPSAQYCSAYETNDGSRIKVIRQGSTYSIGGTVNYANTRFTARFADGSTTEFTVPFASSGDSRKHYPVIIQDSNGNRNRIWYTPGQSGRISHIVDTLNRQIKFYYEDDINGNPDKLVAVTIPGMGIGEEIQTVRFYYETMTLDSANKFSGDIDAPATIRVLKWVLMPATKTAYKYEYHSNYGMIKKIERRVGVEGDTSSLTQTGTIPTGQEGAVAASTEYNFPDGTQTLADVPKYTQRTDDWAGPTASQSQVTHYDFPTSGIGETVSRITVVDDGFEVDYITVSHSTGDWMNGLMKRTEIVQRTGVFSPILSTTKYTWEQGPWQAGRSNPRPAKIEVTNEAGLSKATTFEYDQYSNQTAVKEYGFAPTESLGTLLRTSEIAYETGTGWINKNMLGLPVSLKRTVGGVTVSRTEIEYDGATLTPRNDINIETHSTYYNPAHPSWDEEVCPQFNPDTQSASEEGCVIIHHPGYDSSSAYRGNVTEVKRLLDVSNPNDPNADITAYNYDIAGNLVSATLSCCSLRTWEYSNASNYAFPVSEVSGTSPQLTKYTTYNRNTGLVVETENENGQRTEYQYESDTLRPKKAIFPNDGYIATEYSDKLASSPSEMVIGFIRSTTTLESNKFTESYTYFDGRGQTIRSASLTPDGWNISAVEYDNLGRVRKSYNPFYGSTPVAAIPGGTKFTALTEIDGFGRRTKVTLQDGTFVTTAFSNVNTTPASFPYTFVTATDQAGKQRRLVMDSLGRVVRVDEPDVNGSLGAVDASLPAQQTFYEYDGNDNLTKVIQSDGTVTQERKFRYDSLSRLTHERQVEATPTLDDNGVKGTPDPSKWTKVLKYNLDGLLEWGIDARGVKTTFAYDGLNRMTAISYTGESGYTTPNVTYTYDQPRSGFYNTGALTRVETVDPTGVTPATATEFDHDFMGRIVKHRQWIAGQQYDLEYGYNLAGQLTSQKYPSGRVVTNSYDANGRLAGIEDASRTYLLNLQYQGQSGALSSMAFGNGTVQTFTLNDRFQMTGQELKMGSDVLQKYGYGYGQVDGSGNLDTTKNNGQLAQVESWIGANKQWTQKFTNDHIGRLKQSEERRGDTNALTYKQTFDFDRFGNMYRKTASNNPTGQENPLPYTPIEDSDISKSTNRFTTGTTYDDAGNVVTDEKFRGMGFGYDANGRMVKAMQSGLPEGLSVYDAAGLRVAERVNDMWRFLIYDIGGKLVAEYGGMQATDEGGVKYVLQDWQGSTRAVVGNTGNVQSRSDYTSYGEQINSDTGLRSGTQGFGKPDALRQKYGLTVRDDATGLDHTWFRKHENQAGRWTSPDPYGGSMNPGDPQSFNRYSYVENDPVNFIDPSGLLRIQQCTRYWWRDSDGNYRERISGCVTIFDDSRYGIEDLIASAGEIVEKASDECKKLLGPDAIEKFARISKNISYDDKNLNVPRTSEARTIGENIYLNPWSTTFNEDYRTPREEDKRLNKPTLEGRRRFNEGLRDYNERLEEYGVSAYEYAVAGIIHEFLHAIGKFKPDSGSKQSIQNQIEVLKKCFKKEK